MRLIMPGNRLALVSAALLAGCLFAQVASAAEATSRIEFNRDVRPILSDACFRCHGFDKNAREAGLRLDVPEIALADRDGIRPIVPGKPEESEVVRRITCGDPDERMPPASAHQSLTAAQVQVIKRWISEGAKYQPHWAFIAPVEPPLPEISDAKWAHNGIDHFIGTKLDQEKLTPSPEADKATLLRRVTFDLTGLPPTLYELDSFLADESPDAYERVVDRLLTSPHYGERMALEWLDAARYADTNGYQGDRTRTMWPWRDWVVRAMNTNMPFDQFTIEQLAGDLFPDATVEQKLATGFNRNHPLNGEGGRIPEESRNDYVMDRVETLGTVWLGLTVGCCRCHDHKYDPLAQKEYYQLFAYFNNVDEVGNVDAGGNAHPVMRVETSSDQPRLRDLRALVNEAQAKLDAALPKIDLAQAEWEKTLNDNSASLPPDLVGVGAISPADRTEDQRASLMDHYRRNVSTEYAQLSKSLVAAHNERTDFEKSLPTTMVMRERGQSRKTWILQRGIYDKHGDEVTPGVPAALPPLPSDAPSNRLTLARWLVDPSNPLTARVTVNRYWQLFFGMGLVKTTEDFGVQGETPSHPELLDWLAAQFVHSGWNVKAMHRLIVTSATYRQQSRATSQLLERDASNRLLARGPRHRLSAFSIRDAALAVSGLMVDKLGGPSVKPYQADGVWEDASLGQIRYERDQGEGLYRRSIYTFWRRIASPAMLFDIASRSVCTVRLPRTNTPLQALILMNDIQYVEAARALATKVMKQAKSPEDRVALAFRLCTARRPSDAERQVLIEALTKMLDRYKADQDGALKLISLGDAPRPENADVVELAAYTTVASMVLNLDETITKE